MRTLGRVVDNNKLILDYHDLKIDLTTYPVENTAAFEFAFPLSNPYFFQSVNYDNFKLNAFGISDKDGTYRNNNALSLNVTQSKTLYSQPKKVYPWHRYRNHLQHSRYIHMFPEDIGPIPYINNELNMTSPNLVAASFGMQFLIQMQQKAFANKTAMRTFSNTTITEFSFNALLELSQSDDVQVYCHKDLENSGVTYEVLGDDIFYSISSYRKGLTRIYNLSIAFLPEEQAAVFESLLEVPKKPLYIEWVDRVDKEGDPSSKTIPLGLNKVFYEEAYPCLGDQTLEEFVTKYLASESPILLLYGPPGTGKTSLIRQILHLAQESCMVTYNKDIASMDPLFSHFYDSDERFLVVEDADTYLNSRSRDGNEVMSKLLNITDGLTARKDKKVVFSTNLNNLNDVDEALFREGRCFATLNVGLLTPDQAIVLARLLNLPIKEYPEKGVSLANLYALSKEREIDQSTKQITNGFGFVRR